MLQLKLSEAVRQAKANLDKPLGNDEIAVLARIKRRQRHRLFRQNLDSIPLPCYLQLRLQHVRKLLLESNHSIMPCSLAWRGVRVCIEAPFRYGIWQLV